MLQKKQKVKMSFVFNEKKVKKETRIFGESWQKSYLNLASIQRT